MPSNSRRAADRSEIRAILKKYTTKAALRAYVNRELKKYINKVTLKWYLEHFVSKQDLSRLALQVTRNASASENAVDKIEERLATKYDRIISMLDRLTLTHNQSWNKRVVHDERLRILEEKVGIP